MIDSICSNHMTNDTYRFINIKKYDGGSMKFAWEDDAVIWGIGSVSIDGKHKTNDAYCVQRLRHSLLSVSRIYIKWYEVFFSSTRCVIKKEKIGKIAAGVRTSGNVYYIKDREENNCFLA